MKKNRIRIDELMSAIFLAIMAIIAFVNVINRYFFHRGFAFTEEITVNLFVWITLLGIAIAFRRGANLKMTNLFDKFSPNLKRVALIISAFLGVMIFCFLIYNSAQEIYKNMTFYHAFSEALGIPTWIYSLGTPIFSLFVIKEIIASAIKEIKALKTSLPSGNSENPKKEAQ
ncbi:MAG: 2,3-diketo-L-gulonate TRAP transporter small permease protein YiaM [Spirochaetes bacterium ADurb.Bin110]|nr:MAG: 2,3-diketo-L-gulonate TRAP transporter small permease protein YiaM [Spirochaetes bacterium ADurb.Bin110]